MPCISSFYCMTKSPVFLIPEVQSLYSSLTTQRVSQPFSLHSSLAWRYELWLQELTTLKQGPPLPIITGASPDTLQALVLRSSLALPRLIVECRSCQVANYHQVLPINDVGQAVLTPLGEKMDSRESSARLTQSLVTDVEER